MLIKLFDIQNNKVVPSEHCYTLKSLKKIMDEYPDTYLSIYQYIFYMTCPDPEMIPPLRRALNASLKRLVRSKSSGAMLIAATN